MTIEGTHLLGDLTVVTLVQLSESLLRVLDPTPC